MVLISCVVGASLPYCCFFASFLIPVFSENDTLCPCIDMISTYSLKYAHQGMFSVMFA